MRTMKFRGKRTDTGEWVFGDLIHGVGIKHGRMYILPVTPVYPKGCNELDGWEVIPDTIGQFTGLLDKNDREVYEGDVIQDGSNSIGVIMWFSTGWGMASYTLGFDGINSYTAVDSLYSDEVNEWSAIGNIHDNPELLKGGSNERT